MAGKKLANETEAKELKTEMTNHLTRVEKDGITDDQVNKFVDLVESYTYSSIKDQVEWFDKEVERIHKNYIDALKKEYNWLDFDENHWIAKGHGNRFADEGFEVYEFVYARTRTWDWRPLHVGVLIPGDLKEKRNVAVHVKWHGGGFTTQSWDFQPWFAGYILRHAREVGAVILAPNHRLMPTTSGKGIVEDVEAFWKWYQSDSFLDQLRTIKGWPNLWNNIDRKGLQISGESAGGYLASYSLLETAGLETKAFVTQYPMFRCLTRYFEKEPQDGDSAAWNRWLAKEGDPTDQVDFLQHKIYKKDAYKHAERLWSAIEALEKKGQCPTITRRNPPDGSLPGNILSLTKHNGKDSWWSKFFKRNGDTLDILELLDSKPAEEFKMTSFPEIYIIHGKDDVNCPIKDSMAFKEALQKKWPIKYPSDPGKERIHLIPVDSLTRTDGVKGKVSLKVAHGFDHNIIETEEPFLAQNLLHVSEKWIWNYISKKWQARASSVDMTEWRAWLKETKKKAEDRLEKAKAYAEELLPSVD